MTIDFGLMLPVGPPKGQPGKWLADLDAIVEQMSEIRSLWITDHFFWGDKPTYESLTVLSFLAARYPELEIGPLVLGQGYRNPAALAKMAATLQTLSEGRFVMGLGAGWKEDEFRAYGYDFPSAGVRIQQLEEALIIIKRLWYDAGAVSYDGAHYHIKDAYCEPKPDPVPPIMVGCNGYKALMVAAKHADWWNSSGSIDHYREKLGILHQHCETIGRDPSEIRLTRLMPMAVGKTAARAKRHAEGMGAKTVVGTPKQIIDNVAEFVELGVDYFMFEMPSLPNPDVIELMVNDVIPGIQKLTR